MHCFTSWNIEHWILIERLPWTLKDHCVQRTVIETKIVEKDVILSFWEVYNGMQKKKKPVNVNGSVFG